MNKGTPADPLPAWEDPRVQIVYTLLCADEAPPDREEHWEGWIARRIVAALATKPAEPSRAQKMRDAGYTRRPSWRSLPKDGDDEDESGEDAALIEELERAGKSLVVPGRSKRSLCAEAAIRLRALAETQRSSHTARSDDETAWIASLQPGERGAVQPPAPEPDYRIGCTKAWHIEDKDGRRAAMVWTEDAAIAEQAWQDENNARWSPHRIVKPGAAQRGAALTDEQIYAIFDKTDPDANGMTVPFARAILALSPEDAGKPEVR